MRPKDLAEALEMDRRSLTQLLDRLESGGLVSRRENPEDHRCKIVHLTIAGSEVSRRTAIASARVARRLMGGVSDEELVVVEQVLARISVAIHATASNQAAGWGRGAGRSNVPAASDRKRPQKKCDERRGHDGAAAPGRTASA